MKNKRIYSRKKNKRIKSRKNSRKRNKTKRNKRKTQRKQRGGMEGLEGLAAGLSSEFASPYNKNDIVIIQGLTSPEGNKLNELRAIVHTPKPTRDGRIGCIIEGESDLKGIKRGNLRRLTDAEILYKKWLFAEEELVPFNTDKLIRNNKIIFCHSEVYPGTFTIKPGIRIITFSGLGECFKDGSKGPPGGQDDYPAYLSNELIERIYKRTTDKCLFKDNDTNCNELSEDAIMVFQEEDASSWGVSTTTGKPNYNKIKGMAMKLHGTTENEKMNNMLIHLDCKEDEGKTTTDSRDFCKIEYLEEDDGGRITRNIYDKSQYISILEDGAIDLERLINTLGDGLYILIGCRVLKGYSGGFAGEEEEALTRENSDGICPRLNIKGEKYTSTSSEQCVIS